MPSRPEPPGGATPPAVAVTSDGTEIDLQMLAREICTRYRREFGDEQERYGPAGWEWCLHDNQYLLAWAIQDARDATVVLSDQAAWLAGVLAARDFPVARLVRSLEIAGDVVRISPGLQALAGDVSDKLAAAAQTVSGLLVDS